MPKEACFDALDILILENCLNWLNRWICDTPTLWLMKDTVQQHVSLACLANNVRKHDEIVERYRRFADRMASAGIFDESNPDVSKQPGTPAGRVEEFHHLNRTALSGFDNKVKPGAGRESRRGYMTSENADRIAKAKFKELLGVDNKSEWARVIGCDRKTVSKLQQWKRAERIRKGYRKVAKSLRGTVDPHIIEGLEKGDASALANLSDDRMEWFDSLPEEQRDEFVTDMLAAAGEAE